MKKKPTEKYVLDVRFTREVMESKRAARAMAEITVQNLL